MISIISGRPGAGKTYEAIKYHLLPTLQDGRKVVTNIPVNIEYLAQNYGIDSELIEVVEYDFSDFHGVKMPFSAAGDYNHDWRNEAGQGVVYLIDEAHFSLPKGRTYPDVKRFYTMHRHAGVDIVLITQNYRQIDGDISNLIEVHYKCQKNTALGSDKTYIRKTQDGIRGEVVKTEVRKYDAKIFPIYKSHTMSNGAVTEATARDITPIWRRWPFIGAVLSLLLAVPLFANATNPLRPSAPTHTESGTPIKYSDAAAPQTQRTPPPPPPPRGHPLQNVTLHIDGSYSTRPSGSDYVMLFAAAQNGQTVFTITNHELMRAGYSVQILNDCTAILRYGDYNQFVNCSTPASTML